MDLLGFYNQKQRAPFTCYDEVTGRKSGPCASSKDVFGFSVIYIGVMNRDLHEGEAYCLQGRCTHVKEVKYKLQQGRWKEKGEGRLS